MKRRICSYDAVQVPEACFVLRDAGGDIFLCNGRCLFLWAGMYVTKQNRPEPVPEAVFDLLDPVGSTYRFQSILDVAQWAAANALEGVNNPWLKNAQKL